MASKLLVITPNAGSPFVRADVTALAKELSVELVALDEFRNKFGLALHVLKRAAQRSVGAILLWFLAPAYSLEVLMIARAYRIPVAVMTGGLDIDYVSELGLGGLRWPHNRFRQRLGLRAADLVIAMSDYSAARLRHLATPRRVVVVPMGVDVDRFRPAGAQERLVVTIIYSITRETAKLKGVTTVIEAAALLPEIPFIVVGRSGGDGELERLRTVATDNVTFLNRFLSDDELLALLQHAKVYAQVSAHEGFGLAAAESMACGAIVVGAGSHALREVVGDAGFFVPYGDAPATAEAIRSALEVGDEGRIAARTRIVDNFDFAGRTARLTALLGPLTERRLDLLAAQVEHPRP